MKVLYVNSLYPPDVGGGAEIALAAMVQGFRRRGQDAVVLTTHGGAGVLREQVGGVPVVRMGHKNVYWQHPPQARPAWQRMLWHALDSSNQPMARQAGALIDEIAARADRLPQPGRHLRGGVGRCAERRGILVVQVLHDYYHLCPKVTMFRDGQPVRRPVRRVRRVQVAAAARVARRVGGDRCEPRRARHAPAQWLVRRRRHPVGGAQRACAAGCPRRAWPPRSIAAVHHRLHRRPDRDQGRARTAAGLRPALRHGVAAGAVVDRRHRQGGVRRGAAARACRRQRALRRARGPGRLSSPGWTCASCPPCGTSHSAWWCSRPSPVACRWLARAVAASPRCFSTRSTACSTNPARPARWSARCSG